MAQFIAFQQYQPFFQSPHKFEIVESKLEAGYNLSHWKITPLISVLDTTGQCQGR